MRRPDNKTILLIGIGVLFILIFLTTDNQRVVTEIERPDYRETGDTKLLYIVDEGGQQIPVEFSVDARQLSGNQLLAAFDETYDAACEKMRRNNASLQSITTDLAFVSKPGKYGIKVDYSLNDYSVISPLGVVDNKQLEAAKSFEITLTLAYGIYRQSYVVPVTVLPAELTREEQLVQRVLEEISHTGREDAKLALPTEVDGQRVIFLEKTGERTTILLLVVLLGFVAFYYQRVVMPKKETERRENLLKRDYSEVVSTLSLLVGAGMSTRNALMKMAEDYQARQKQPKRPAYEEICVLVRKLDSGVPEQTAYQEFGKACRLHCYIRFSGLLTQSLKKGNEELLLQLWSESTESFSERKSMAIRQGEKANTKLVLPMIMMLTIVFIIIMVPAFISMG